MVWIDHCLFNHSPVEEPRVVPSLGLFCYKHSWTSFCVNIKEECNCWFIWKLHVFYFYLFILKWFPPTWGCLLTRDYTRQECRVLTTGLPGSSLFGVFKKLFSRQCSPEKLHHFTVPTTTYKCFSSTSSPDSLVLSLIFFSSHSDTLCSDVTLWF